MIEVGIEATTLASCPVFIATAYLDCPISASGTTSDKAVEALYERLEILQKQINQMFIERKK